MQEALLSQPSPSQHTLCEEQACFSIHAFTLRPLEHPGGPFLSPEVEMDPPPGALRESPGVSALRSALEGGKPVRAGLCSQDTFVPGDAQPVRYVEGESGRLSAPVAWGLGTWTVAAQGTGGSAAIGWAPRTP